jgi:hypothetical protein
MDSKSELQDLLNSYTTDMQSLVAIKAKDFSTLQTATLISSIPERKWNAAQGVVTFTLAKKEADRVAKVLRATKMMKANQFKDKLTNADDRKSWVEDQPEVQIADRDALNAEAELLSAKMAYECLDDLFTASKKIMDYLVDRDRQTKEYDKFVNAGRVL